MPKPKLINDVAVNPISKNVYVSAARGRGPDAAPLVVRVDASGKLTLLPLDNIKHETVNLSDAPADGGSGRQNPRTQTITDMAFVNGNLMVADTHYSRVLTYTPEGELLPRATLGVLRSQLDENDARRSRLMAEREGADSIVFPEALAARADETAVAAALSGEVRLFDSRKAVRAGQRAQLRERISQSTEEVRGLSAQQQAKENENSLITEELIGVADLGPHVTERAGIVGHLALQALESFGQGIEQILSKYQTAA
jgi:hypothetical protein